MAPRTAIIIGAGPAGLTAAYELVTRTDIRPIVLEMSDMVGGLSRTVNHNGNLIDIGGHRFFSKSDRVMRWWLQQLPLQGGVAANVELTYQNKRRTLATAAEGPSPEQEDAVMLVRERRSRIYYQGHFYNYPVTLNQDTIRKLGLQKTARIGASYLKASLMPRAENNLEDFMINRFGNELYRTFFRDYTYKVWGRPCNEISAEWGAQRIKGLSLRTAAAHFFTRLLPSSPTSLEQRTTETSLIERFLYPKLGPGQMWRQVAQRIREHHGEIHHHWRVTGLESDPDHPNRIRRVIATDSHGRHRSWAGDLVFSTMPMKNLVRAMRDSFVVPDDVSAVREGLIYRAFTTTGLLLGRL